MNTIVPNFGQPDVNAVFKDRRTKGEFTGSNVNYYLLGVLRPKRLAPYTAEAEDIIEGLKMTFAEGCAFKAIWRSCAAANVGVFKEGMDIYGIYDAEKIVYYGQRILAQRKNNAEGVVVERVNTKPLEERQASALIELRKALSEAEESGLFAHIQMECENPDSVFDIQAGASYLYEHQKDF